VAGRPLRPATDHRHGRPLPHRPANRPQAPPRAGLLPFVLLPIERAPYAELPAVSHGYPPPQGRLPTCYAPVRRAAPPKGSALDLHALGTPPALILSQDQTLHQWLQRAGPPQGSHLLRVMVTRCVLALVLAVVRVRIPGARAAVASTAATPESARSVFGTRHGDPAVASATTASHPVRCASLSRYASGWTLVSRSLPGVLAPADAVSRLIL
jgi:hypothetical protein